MPLPSGGKFIAQTEERMQGMTLPGIGLRKPHSRGRSSVARAPALHAGGRGFESHRLHRRKGRASRRQRAGAVAPETAELGVRDAGPGPRPGG